MSSHADVDLPRYTPDTIWNARQNNPELVVQDLKNVFNLSEQDCQVVRYILMIRGVNKWLLARRRFIALKHRVKEMRRGNSGDKALRTIQQEMQTISNMPRWVEWPPTTTRNWKKIEEDIYIAGRPC